MPTPPPVTPPESGSSSGGVTRIGPGQSRGRLIGSDTATLVGREVPPFTPAFWIVRNITASETLGASFTFVRADASGGAVTVTLPPASQYIGQMVGVVKADSGTNPVTVAAGSGDSLYFTPTSVLTQYDGMYLIAVDDGAGGYGWNQLGGAGGMSLTQVRFVSQSPGDYTTIQDAIDSITDASSVKPYTVFVAPGVYDEQVTMQQYVSVVGIDRESVVVTHTGDDNGTFIGANDTTLSNLTIELSGVDTEWGYIATDPERVNLKDLNMRGTSEYAYTSNAVKATGTGYRFVIDGCRIMFGTDVDVVEGVVIELAPVYPEEQEVVIRNSWIYASYDNTAIVLGGVNYARINAVDILGDVSISNCDFVGVTACRAGAVSVSAGTGETVYLQVNGAYLDSAITTSGVGTVKVSGHYSVVRTLGDGAVSLVVPGGVLRAITSVSSTYTALYTDEVVLADATGGAFTVTLPTAVGHGGKVFTVKRMNSGANAVTIGTTSSQTIDGATTASLSSQYSARTVVSDGTNWQVLATV